MDIYTIITNRIIEQLEEGIIPWRKPWSGVSGGAFNRITKKPYSLLNQMLLPKAGEYATFKQWSSLGGKIKRGEKAYIVTFYKRMVEQVVDDNGEVITEIPRMVLRYYKVFHIDQIEGVEPLDNYEPIVHNPIKEAEDIIDRYDERETIRMEDYVGNKAYYAPLIDYLRVPVKEQFENIEEYYSTKFHEMVHSTGHKKRLNRFDDNTKIAAFGSQDYSKEELIAEIGAACLMNTVGIETEKTFKNSAAYIQSWISVLKNNKKFITSASTNAKKAVEYILNGKEGVSNV